jgi:hypothetical protein
MEEHIQLPDSGSLARVAYFEISSLAVVVTHPWGVIGGNMHNNVVQAVCKYFQSLEITTLRFDFCGSQIGPGHTQVRQVSEAANFLLNQEDTSIKRILLVGYSYGSVIAGAATASIPECVGMIWIAPPLGYLWALYTFAGNGHLEKARQRSTMPQLMIMGSHDNFTSKQTFLKFVKTMQKNFTTANIMNDADHFYRHRESEMLQLIGKLSAIYNTPD